MLDIKQLTRLQIIRYCEKLEKENKKLKESLYIATKCSSKEEDWIIRLSEENKKLKEKLDAFESSKFYTMALLEIQHPKTAREAENLLQVKKVFERLYNDRLYCLEQENENLKADLEKFSEAYKKYRDYEKEELAESCYDLARENDKLKEENKWFNKKIKQAGKYVAATMKENKKLKAEFDNYKKKVSEDMKVIVKNQIENIKLFDKINGEYKKLEQENKKLKNLKICWKTVEERIEIDKGVVIGKY